MCLARLKKSKSQTVYIGEKQLVTMYGYTGRGAANLLIF
jgi:hypothetical protein